MTSVLLTPKRSLHERVAAAIRTDILAPLHPGAKLASEAELAKEQGVSILTLRQALSVLAHEGMIERRHGSGTYVTDHRRRQGVAVGTVAYDGRGSSSFQTRLFLMLSELFRREGYRCRSYVAPLGFLEGWAELAEDVEHGRIMGAAFVSMSAESIQIPFAEKGVPYVGGDSDAPVTLDYFELVRTGVRRLVEQGCRKIAFMQLAGMGVPVEATDSAIRSALTDEGLAIHEPWIRQVPSIGNVGAGWRHFREIWSARDEKPDGLLVTDDVLFSNVAMAILDAHIDVPGQLKIVTHANKGSGLAYPFPVDFLEVDVEEWAQALVRRLISLMNKEPAIPRHVIIPARLVLAGSKSSAGTFGEARTIVEA